MQSERRDESLRGGWGGGGGGGVGGVVWWGGVGVRGCLVLVFEFRLRGQELFFFWNCRHTNLTKV